MYRSTLTFMLLNALPALGNPTVSSYKSSSVKKIILRNISGTTRILGSDPEELRLEINRKKWGNHCRLQTEQKGSELHTIIENTSDGLFSKECEADISYLAASGTEFDLKASAGNVSIQNMKGQGKIKNGSGNINIEHSLMPGLQLSSGAGNIIIKDSEFRELRSRLGSGNLNAEGSFSVIDHHAGSGNTTIFFRNVPQKGFADFKTGSGNITVSFLKNSRISASVTTAIGNSGNQFPTADDGYRVRLSAGVGNVEIKKY